MVNKKIHHSKTVKLYSICELNNEDSIVVKYKKFIKIQFNNYYNHKKATITRKNPNKLLITQDFTQLKLKRKFIQNLII